MSQRLASIPGIGVLTATALAATVGEGHDFSNGRQLAAYLGLVPRQVSSGGKARLLGISKRGDGYLRGLLIHGARSVIYHIQRRLKAGQSRGNPWVEQLLQRCHPIPVRRLKSMVCLRFAAVQRFRLNGKRGSSPVISILLI